MKKLLVLALVLSMAGMANAALTLSISDTEMVQSDTAIIQISGDGQDPPSYFYLGVLVGGPGSLDISNATIVYGGNATGIYFEDIGGAIGTNEPTVHIDLGDIPPVGQNSPPLDGLLVDGIIFHCDGEGEVTIILTDLNGVELDRVTIMQTPEPITIGLLGLGALMLRRRK